MKIHFPASLLSEFTTQTWHFKYLEPHLMSSAEIIKCTQGIVSTAETLNYRTHEPVKHGLFCEKIFASPSRYEEPWLEAHQHRLNHIPQAFDMVQPHPHNTHMGLIHFASPLIHPWFIDHHIAYLVEHTQLDASSCKEIIHFRQAVLVQGDHIDVRSEQEINGHEDQYHDAKILWGARGIRYLLQTSNASTAMIINHLCVLPPDFRPAHQAINQKSNRYDLNGLYRVVVQRNARLFRLMELQAPPLIINNETRLLQEAYSSLINHQFAHASSQEVDPIHSIQTAIDVLLENHDINIMLEQLDQALAYQVDDLSYPLPYYMFTFIRYLRVMGIRLIP